MIVDTASDEEVFDGGFGRLYCDDVEREVLSVVECGGVRCLASVTPSQRYAVQGKILWPGATTLAALSAAGVFPCLEAAAGNAPGTVVDTCELYAIAETEMEVNGEDVPDVHAVTDADVCWEESDLQTVRRVMEAVCVAGEDRPAVCELGAGCGLAGFAAAARPARPCTLLTDVDLDVVALLQRNVRQFAQDGVNVAAAPLDWKNEVPAALRERFDLVLGADVAHRAVFYEDLCRTAAKLLKKNGCFVMSNGIYRCEDPLLLEAATRWGMKPLLHERYEALGVVLFVLQRTD